MRMMLNKEHNLDTLAYVLFDFVLPEKDVD